MRKRSSFGASDLVRNRYFLVRKDDLSTLCNTAQIKAAIKGQNHSKDIVDLFTLLDLVRNRPKFGAKSTFLPLWIWCEINLNLVPNRHTIWCEIDRIPSRRKWVLV